MKKQIKLAFAAALGAMTIAAPVQAADWYAPQEPFAIYGNTYYVGTGGLSAVLITSPAGHILIDAGGPKAPPQIAEHIRKLGFKVKDIRYILNSHEHFDHAGGIAAMQKLSGAKVLASPESVKVLTSGQPDKGDAQYPNLEAMTPVADTHAVRDGETVTLGSIKVTAHYTPGHTKGATSWTWQSTEGGRTVNMVYADSLNAIAADGLRFSGNPLYPKAQADVERSIAAVESLKCDVIISAHPEASDLWDRKAKQNELGNAAFVDKDGCRKYAAKARAQLEQQLLKERAATAQNALECTEMVDAASGKRLVHEGQCEQRMPPMSTFKIAISLMGYDSGILLDEHTPRLPFKEGYVDRRPEWRVPTDPAYWMQKSVVWYSQQVTSKLGAERFQRYVKSFDYGNKDVAGDPGKHNGLTQAWLESSLKISPVEQVAFLRKVVNRKLPLSKNAYDMTGRILKLQTTANGWEIYAKTGSGSVVPPDGSSKEMRKLGWFVGWATKGQRTIVFARFVQEQKEQEGPAAFRVRDAFLRELPARLDSL